MSQVTVGVPKEIKVREKRVALTPEGVAWLTGQGVEVRVQRGAGLASGFDDEAYQKAGASLSGNAAELYEKSGLIVKVKEPQKAEFPFIQPKHILFCYLHLAAPESFELVKALVRSGAAGIAFETLEVEGRRPLLKPMSEIAGGLAAAFGSYLFSRFGKFPKSLTLSSTFHAELEQIALKFPEPPAGFFSPRTLIWGGGAAGEKALDFCLAMGGRVALVEKNPARREELRVRHAQQNAVFFSPENLDKEVLEASELFIGAVHTIGNRAFKVLTQEQLESASRDVKKVMVDIAIDQGGNFPYAEAKNYEEPLYWDPCGNLRFSVSNMPSLCGPSASREIEKAALPYILALSKNSEKALNDYPELKQAMNIQAGKILLEAVKTAHPL